MKLGRMWGDDEVMKPFNVKLQGKQYFLFCFRGAGRLLYLQMILL